MKRILAASLIASLALFGVGVAAVGKALRWTP